MGRKASRTWARRARKAKRANPIDRLAMERLYGRKRPWRRRVG